MDKETTWPLSNHFDGNRFYNPAPRTQGFRDFVRWMTTRKPGPWPQQTSNTYAAAPPKRVDDLRVTFIGHTTLLVQMNGVNILTDPIWSMRASPLSWIGPRRRAMPGIRFSDLPPIDAVAISHDHYDHFDSPTLKQLAQEHDPVFITGLGNGGRLAELGIRRVVTLDWWDGHAIRPDLRVTAVPARHFSGRTPFDRNTTLWCGFTLEGPSGCVYFAGDTGFGDHFAQIEERCAPIRLALLPIGAFRPEWFMGEVHCSPTEASEAHRILHPRITVATHFGSFPLADDGQTEPVDALRAIEKKTACVAATNFWILKMGEGRDIPAL